MTDAIVVDVCKAIETFIRAYNFGDEPVTVQRRWGDRNDDLSDTELRQIIIDVTPWMTMCETDASGVTRHDLEIDIYVRRSLSENEQDIGQGVLNIDEIDRLVKITQDLFISFLPRDGTSTGILATDAGNEAKIDPDRSRVLTFCDRKQLKQLRTFSSWMRLAYIVT